MNNAILVIDVEMTCWDEPTDQTSEIIQIGVVEVDIVRLLLTRKRMMYVKPEHSDVSAYCTQLTGITKRQAFKQGLPYDKAIDILHNKFGFKNKTVFGWGNDNKAFKDGINNYVNLSALYSMMSGTVEKFNLEAVMKYENIEFVGKAHDALIDAENTAVLLCKLFERIRFQSRDI